MIRENATDAPQHLSNSLAALKTSDVTAALQPDLSDGQVQVAVELIETASVALETLTRLTDSKFKGRGSIRLSWARRGRFDAAAVSLTGGHDYLIQIDVGAPIALLAMAHEIWRPEVSSPATPSMSEHDIVTGHMKPGQITRRARRTAIDATFLLYFHELAHVLWNHCQLDWSATPSRDRRALEHSADYYAGVSFVTWKTAALPQPFQSDWDDIADSLVCAALLLATGLKAFSAPTDEYHYPSVRMMGFMAGGFGAIGKACDSKGLQQAFPDGTAEDAFISPRMTEFLNRLRPTDMRRLGGTESEIRTDFEQLHNVTEPRANELRDKLGTLWDSLE